jgi:cation diffusion facilitator family transporter
VTEKNHKLHAASFSVGVNLFLIVLKLIVAFLTGSLAVLAELLHSVFDLLASVFAYLGIRKADEPADGTHHYGHEKFENLSSLAQTILIVITSIIVIYEAMSRISNPTVIESSELGVAVMLITIVVDYRLSKFLHKASRDHGSAALEADAYHFTTDLWGALAVIVGLVFVSLGYPIFDSLAAIVVALLMLRISYHLGAKALHVLLDKSPPADVVGKIGEVIKSTPGVKSFHKLRARQAGSRILIEVHIQVSPEMTVKESHLLSHEVKERLMKEVSSIKEATIHVEPDQ